MSFGFPNTIPTCPRQCSCISIMSLVVNIQLCISPWWPMQCQYQVISDTFQKSGLLVLCILLFQQISGRLKSSLRAVACNTEPSGLFKEDFICFLTPLRWSITISHHDVPFASLPSDHDPQALTQTATCPIGEPHLFLKLLLHVGGLPIPGSFSITALHSCELPHCISVTSTTSVVSPDAELCFLLLVSQPRVHVYVQSSVLALLSCF